MKAEDSDTNNTPERVEDCDCLLTNTPGKLEIRDKTLRFVSDNYIGRLPFKEIEKVFIKSVKDKNILYLVSKKGLIRF